jgi:hypothetical protein
MPSRFLSLAIVAFWMATTGWWFYREFAVSLWFDEPPPFTIDLADEVRASTGTIDWQVFRDDQPVGSNIVRAQKVGTAYTDIRYRIREDLFDLTGKFDFQFPLNKHMDARLQLSSLYQVTREGNLRWIRAEIEATMPPFLGQSLDIRACMEGPVHSGRFEPELRFQSPWSKEIKLTPVELSGRGSVLNPMHPVNRIAGLRRGQRWRMPFVDPLSVALADHLPGLGGTSQVRFLDAEVERIPRSLGWDADVVRCFLIRYYNDEMTACTWVRESDGVVLQQEVFSSGQGSRLILRRKPQNREHPGFEAW